MNLQVQLDKVLSQDVLNKALGKAALLVEERAKQKCPVDTGNLRGSIGIDIVGNTAYIGTNVEYAPYVEYGTGLYAANGDGRKDVPWRYQTADGEWHSTKGQSPQPYLEPALEESKAEILEIFKEAIENV